MSNDSTPATPKNAPAEELVTELEQQGIAPGSYEVQPLDMMRRAIARRLTESAREIPHYSLNMNMEIDAFLALRSKINKGVTGNKVSLNDMFIKACALALTRVPEANVSFHPKGFVTHHHADISVAVAIKGGLITPIVRQAEDKNIQDIAREMKDLASRARTKKLSPNEYFGGTFTISNLGMFGISSFSSILNPPQSCILSVGAGTKQTCYRGDEPYVATILTVTLTCDHRAVDGAAGSRWLKEFKAIIESPGEIAG